MTSTSHVSVELQFVQVLWHFIIIMAFIVFLYQVSRYNTTISVFYICNKPQLSIGLSFVIHSAFVVKSFTCTAPQYFRLFLPIFPLFLPYGSNCSFWYSMNFTKISTTSAQWPQPLVLSCGPPPWLSLPTYIDSTSVTWLCLLFIHNMHFSNYSVRFTYSPNRYSLQSLVFQFQGVANSLGQPITSAQM